MLNKGNSAVLIGALLALCVSAVSRADMTTEITQLQHEWARAYYLVPKKDKEAAFDALTNQAKASVLQYPGHAEPMIWEAIVLSSHAKFAGGLGALSKVKHARALLLQAEKIDPNALNGSIYASLGSLYANVPGWPIGYGDKKLARQYLEKALQLNPDGIDPNYFYGELMAKLNDKAAARSYYEKALLAAARPGRADADRGRRAEVQQALADLR